MMFKGKYNFYWFSFWLVENLTVDGLKFSSITRHFFYTYLHLFKRFLILKIFLKSFNHTVKRIFGQLLVMYIKLLTGSCQNIFCYKAKIFIFYTQLLSFV